MHIHEINIFVAADPAELAANVKTGKEEETIKAAVDMAVRINDLKRRFEALAEVDYDTETSDTEDEEGLSK